MTPDLRLVTDHTASVAVDADTGEEFLIRTYADGAQTLCRRPHLGATWGPEFDLLPVGGAA